MFVGQPPHFIPGLKFLRLLRGTYHGDPETIPLWSPKSLHSTPCSGGLRLGGMYSLFPC